MNKKNERSPIRQLFGIYASTMGGASAIVALVLSMPIGFIALAAAVCAIGLALMYTRIAAAVLVAVLVASCGVASAGKPTWFKSSEQTSNKIAEAANKAVPYPLAVVKQGGFLERKNQVEKLKRFSDANKVGYVYIMSFGKFVGYYTIKGKVSSVNSALTNVNQTWDPGNGQSDTVVDSIGDDGTFGTNEGGDRGIFFFTQQGTLVVTVLDWQYSDQPLAVDVPNLVK